MGSRWCASDRIRLSASPAGTRALSWGTCRRGRATLGSKDPGDRCPRPRGMADYEGVDVIENTDRRFYLLSCVVCDGDRPLPMPFGSPAERGKWAAEHNAGTGHDEWRVWDEPRAEVPRG